MDQIFPHILWDRQYNNSDCKESSAIEDFSKNSEIERNSEFKENSAIGDSSKDSAEASSQMELRQKASIHSKCG